MDSPKGSGSALRELLLSRLLHISVMALNYLHATFRHVPYESLQRHPNQAQLCVYGRLRVLLRASSRHSEDLPECAGRRGTHLVARLTELEQYLKSAGLSSTVYPEEGCLAATVPHLSEGPFSLTPYKEVDPERLLITGHGEWDIEEYLGPELLLPILEPLTIRGVDPAGLPFPDATHNDPDLARSLFRLWDCKGLLSIAPGPLAPRQLCNPNEKADRLIGDRRGPNSLEGRLIGPSTTLPPGFLLCCLTVPRYSHVLVGASTDRFHVTKERACGNAVVLCFPCVTSKASRLTMLILQMSHS